MEPIRIVTFTAVWRRPEIFKICLKGIRRLIDYDPARFQIEPFFVVSEISQMRQLAHEGLDFIFHKNNPVGEKLNAGLRCVMENFEFDYLLEIGSDDLIANNYLDDIEPWLRAKIPQLAATRLHFIDSITGMITFFETAAIFGLGRCISRATLERFAPDYNLWNDYIDRGHDRASWRNMVQKHIPVLRVSNRRFSLLDIKSEENINTIEPYTFEKMSAKELLKHYPEGDEVLRLIEQNAPERERYLEKMQLDYALTNWLQEW